MLMKMNIYKIEAYSLCEAMKKAEALGLTVTKNVTRRRAADPDTAMTDFANAQFEKDKLTDTTGVGYIVVETPGSADTRMRPYTLNDTKSTPGMVKTRVFEVRTVADDKLVLSARTKGEAIRKAKAAMKDYKEDLRCEVVYRLDDEHKTAFTLDYTPSVNTTLGVYYVFGN